jgi:hypothetical protein
VASKASDVVAECPLGALTEADPALLLPLAMEDADAATYPVDILKASADALGRPDTGIEPEENECVVAAAGIAPAILAAQQRCDLRFAERLDDRLLESDGR